MASGVGRNCSPRMCLDGDSNVVKTMVWAAEAGMRAMRKERRVIQLEAFTRLDSARKGERSTVEWHMVL